jgi:hypothetical protein
VALQPRIHDSGTTPAPGCCFDDSQLQGCHPKSLVFDDVDRLEVTAAHLRPRVLAAVGVPRHGYLDDVGVAADDVVPPSGRKTAAGGVRAVGPDRCSDACCGRERAVIGEVHALGEAAPLPGLHSAADSAWAESVFERLTQSDDAVVPAQ